MPETARQILVVEDQPEILAVLADMLRTAGWRVIEAEDGEAALEIAANQRPDAVLTDLSMPRLDGMSLLRALNDRYPGLPVVVLTAFGTVPSAVEAIQAGAFDFLTKPVESPEQLRSVMRRALDSSPAQSSRMAPISEDPVSQEVFAVARVVAPRPTTVLLTGESGVGKEVCARYLHDHSKRHQGPFLAINCASLPESLLESELFGHEKGAFTGATQARAGTFEQANDGSLLLDEVGEMAPALQAKFLRVLEDRTVTRLGGSGTHAVDVRLMAATNRNLEADVAAGRFREDLFYRLNVFPIHIPPLRDRPGDILPLARHFLGVLGSDAHLRPLRLSPGAETALLGHHWPGNVRELSNVIERAVVLAGTADIQAGHLRLGAGHPSTGAQPLHVDKLAETAPDAPTQGGGARSLKELEIQAILDALAETGGNRSQAAERLGIARRTLHYKLKKYGIE